MIDFEFIQRAIEQGNAVRWKSILPADMMQKFAAEIVGDGGAEVTVEGPHGDGWWYISWSTGSSDVVVKTRQRRRDTA